MAKRIELILTDSVLKLGEMGDLVAVTPGYARNYLLPQGLAIPAGQAAKRQVELLREEAQKRELERQGKALALKKELDGLSVQIAAKVAHDNVLFGSVGIREIQRALSVSGVEVDNRQVHLHESFKQLGTYQVAIRLHKDVEATISVEVVNDNPDASMDEVLGDQEAVEAAADY